MICINYKYQGVDFFDINENLHRLNGPALIMCKLGYQVYYIEGKLFSTQYEFEIERDKYLLTKKS